METNINLRILKVTVKLYGTNFIEEGVVHQVHDMIEVRLHRWDVPLMLARRNMRNHVSKENRTTQMIADETTKTNSTCFSKEVST